METAFNDRGETDVLEIWAGGLFGYEGQHFMHSLSLDPPNRGIPSAGPSVLRLQQARNINISVTFQVSVRARVQYRPRYDRLWGQGKPAHQATFTRLAFRAHDPAAPGVDAVADHYSRNIPCAMCCGQHTSHFPWCRRNDMLEKNCAKQAFNSMY